MLTIGSPVCPNDCRGSEMFPVICVLVTLAPGMEAKGFELSKGFQLKGLLKGTEVVPLVGGATMGPIVVTVGVYPEGLEDPLTIVMTVGLGLGRG